MLGSMSSGSSGDGPLRRMVPRLAGRIIPPMSVNPFSGPLIHGSYMGTMKWIGCVSGTGKPRSRAPEQVRLARGQAGRRRPNRRAAR